MNKIIQAMETRRSIRKFRPDLPTKAQIDQITEAGLYAASGRGKQAVITVAESTYTNLVIQLSQPENKEICFHTPHFGKNSRFRKSVIQRVGRARPLRAFSLISAWLSKLDNQFLKF